MDKIEKATKLLLEGLEKARKMPIGTVSKSGKYKKVAEGKWIPVEKEKGKNIEQQMEEAENKVLKKLESVGWGKEEIGDARLTWKEINALYKKHFKKIPPTELVGKK